MSARTGDVSHNEPIILSAHRDIIQAEGPDGLRYEVTRDPSTHPEVEATSPDRSVTLSFTPEEARRVSTYMTAVGWRRVRVVSVPMIKLRDGQRPLMLDSANAKRTIRFAAAGSIACCAVTDGTPEEK